MKVIWSTKAIRQNRKIKDAKERDHIYDMAQSLVNYPKCKNIKQLVNHDYDYRMRVGRYRVLFTLDEKAKEIIIEEVKKRDDRTY